MVARFKALYSSLFSFSEIKFSCKVKQGGRGGGGGVNISWMDMCCCFCTSCNVPFWWPKTDMRIDSRYVFFLSFDNSQSKLCLECLYLYIACVKCVGRRDGLRSLLGYISSYQPFPNRNKKLERVLKFWMGLPKQSIGSEHVNTFVFLL